VFAGLYGSTNLLALTGDELGKHANTKALRIAAMAYAQMHFVGKCFVNASSGHEIRVSATGIKHTISGAAADLIKTIPGLAKVLQEAQLYATEPDKHGDRNVLAIEKYQIELSLSGVNLNVLITVKHHLDGRRYYDHGFVAKKNPPMIGCATEPSCGSSPEFATVGFLNFSGF
jgi:Large polyvalent protein-associated domain 3